MRQPSTRWKIGQEHPGVRPWRADDGLGQFAAFLARQIQGDRLLALVETRPEETGPTGAHGPPVMVEPARHAVDTNDLRPELSQGHSTERRRDEGGGLHQPQARENLRHAARPRRASSSRLRAITLSANVSSAPSKIESTRASTK